MRRPGKASSWVVVVTLVLLATGAGIASVATSPPGQSTRKTVPTTSLPPPPVGRTTVPRTVPPTPTTTVPFTGEVLIRLDFLDSQRGFGLFDEYVKGACSLAVAPTHDGGVTFSARAALPSPASCSGPWSLAFDDHGDGFVYGPGLVTSHDGGQTWTNPGSSILVLSIIPVGSSVWQLGAQCDGTDSTSTCALDLYVSGDGGRTWADSDQMPGGVIRYYSALFGWTWLVRPSASTGVVVFPKWDVNSDTSTTALLTTADGGQTWAQQATPCPMPNPDVYLMANAPDGTTWLSCSGEPAMGSMLKSVMRSANGGRTWTVEASCAQGPSCGDLAYGYLGGLAGLSAATAVINGARGSFLITHDGGVTWTQSTLPETDHSTPSSGLDFVNAREGWVVVGDQYYGSSLWRTIDGGNSWRQVWPPSTEQVCQPYRGSIWRSTGTWALEESGSLATRPGGYSESSGAEPGVSCGLVEASGVLTGGTTADSRSWGGGVEVSCPGPAFLEGGGDVTSCGSRLGSPSFFRPNRRSTTMPRMTTRIAPRIVRNKGFSRNRDTLVPVDSGVASTVIACVLSKNCCATALPAT